MYRFIIREKCMKTFHDDRYQTLTFIAVHFKFAAMYSTALIIRSQERNASLCAVVLSLFILNVYSRRIIWITEGKECNFMVENVLLSQFK